MSLALQSLVALTLLVAAAVASLPLLLGGPAPRPDPGAPSLQAEPLRIVEAPGGRWYLRGDPISRAALTTLLHDSRPERLVQYLPSAALSMGEVSASLRWLRRINAPGAVLALPPANNGAAPIRSAGGQP